MKFLKIGVFLFIFGTVGIVPRALAQEVPGEFIVKLRPATSTLSRKARPNRSPAFFQSFRKILTVRPLFASAGAASPLFSQTEAFKKQFYLIRVKASVKTDSLVRALQKNNTVA